MLFCCFWHNVQVSCHKYFVVSRHKQAPLLSTSGKCRNLPRSTGTVLITSSVRSVDSTRRSQILVGNRDFCLPPLEYCRDIWYGITKMVWLTNGEKFGRYVCLYDKIHECDRQTPHDCTGRACTAKSLYYNFIQTLLQINLVHPVLAATIQSSLWTDTLYALV